MGHNCTINFFSVSCPKNIEPLKIEVTSKFYNFAKFIQLKRFYFKSIMEAYEQEMIKTSGPNCKTAVFVRKSGCFNIISELNNKQ